MNLRAVDVLVKGLTQGVTHPGDGKDQPAKLLMPLPGFRNAGLPPEQAKHFANEAGLPDNDTAKLYAEALVTALETDLALIPRSELEQLRAQAATPEDVNPTAPEVSAFCHCNSQMPLVVIPVGNRAQVMLDGGTLKRQLDGVCTC